MKKILMTLALLLAPFTVSAFDDESCEEGNIVLLRCQLDEVKKGVEEGFIFQAALQSVRERLTPPQEDLDNGTEILAPVACSSATIRMNPKSDQQRVLVSSVCQTTLRHRFHNGETSEVTESFTIVADAGIENIYESYYGVIDTLSIVKP